MWRNVNWNSTESNLPEGMHKHETGAYFKTPSIQSATSLQSENERDQTSTESAPVRNQTANQAEPLEQIDLGQVTPSREFTRPKLALSKRQRLQQQQQQASKTMTPPSSKQQAAAPPTHNFRSRLSSISGALQHPKLAKRLFSNHHQHQQPQSSDGQPAVELASNHAAIQITTTSIDSPQHHFGANQQQHQQQLDDQHELQAKLAHSSSGRRLSQLFLPQQMNANNPMLAQDPYGLNNELIPPHLLGLYGQPPLVGGAMLNSAGSSVATGHRASWADISLFGRLSNVRPSIDSAFHSTQMRHSFDARKYPPNSRPKSRLQSAPRRLTFALPARSLCLP